MKFISAKLLKPPTVTPIEYCYNARDDGCGDEIRVRCEEWPVPEVVQQLQLLSRPVDVRDERLPEHCTAADMPMIPGLEE